MDETQTRKASLKQTATIACIVLAFWPVWRWYATRTLDRSDEPWGLLALTTAILLIFLERRRREPGAPLSTSSPWRSTLGYCALIVTLSAYAATFAFAPNLLQSVFLVTSIWLVLTSLVPMPSQAGILGLLLLALPVVPSLNFYAGYPIRYMVAAGSAFMLNCLGLHAVPEGTLLSVDQRLVAIDAPCSGINMLWTELYAAMVVASIFKLNLRNTAVLTLCVLVLIPISNTVRATSLVLFDQFQTSRLFAGLTNLEPAVHTAVGLIVFCLVTGTTIFLAGRLALSAANSQSSSQTPRHLPESWQSRLQFHLSPSSVKRCTSWLQSFVVIVCIVSALLPFIARPGSTAVEPQVVPRWPEKIDEVALVPVESLEEEKAFAADFPGLMKRFTDGSNSYFIRYVRKETRQLHPSSDCFRGLGYSTQPLPLVVSRDGSRWSSFMAEKTGARYIVTERIFDQAGQSWTDVSDWYWSAALGKSKGPWFDVTVAKPAGLQKQQ